jgi:hypothetical protein
VKSRDSRHMAILFLSLYISISSKMTSPLSVCLSILAFKLLLVLSESSSGIYSYSIFAPAYTG